MQPQDPSQQHLIFIDPQALMYLLDKSCVVHLSSGGQNGNVLKAEVLKENQAEPQNSIKTQQDGITIYIDSSVETSPEQQINITLKKGWILSSLHAEIVKKQGIPGFMGIRKC